MNIKDLIEYIAKALVDHPEQVKVSEIEGEKTSVIELYVAKEDLGKIIGKQGRTVKRFDHLGRYLCKIEETFCIRNHRMMIYEKGSFSHWQGHQTSRSPGKDQDQIFRRGFQSVPSLPKGVYRRPVGKAEVL
jgi:predicted RNA-binding protein YlqC (UPF0109 family)